MSQNLRRWGTMEVGLGAEMGWDWETFVNE